MDSFDDNVKNAYYCKIVDFVNTLNNKQCTNVCYIKGKLFEYISAIYFKSRLYDNISTDYKEQLNLSNYDCDSNSAGVDIIDTLNNKIIQCKYYKQKTLYRSNITNFVITLLNLYNKFTGILAVNEDIKLAKNLNNDTINNCSIEKIPDNIYNQIINDAFDYVKHDHIENTPLHTDNFILRDYQKEIIQIIDSNDKYKFKLPCGTGKSFIIAHYINTHPNLKCIVLTPSINLANDMCNLINFPVNQEFCTGSCKNNKYNSTIAVYNTAFNKYIANNNFLTDYDICFIDEAHHYDNNAYSLKSIQTKRMYLFSATTINDCYFPFYEYTYKDAIKNNYILDFNMNVHYVKNINYNTAVHILKKYIQYQHVIIYCNRIEDCKELTDLLIKNNISAQCITSDNKDSYQIIQDFRNNKFRCIVNCNMINEGIDIKNCETAFFFDNRFSYNQIIQCVGRTQRCYKNKLNGNFVIMANDENKDNLVNRYLNVLAETNTNYIDSTEYKLNFYNDYHIDKIEENSLEEESNEEEEFFEFERYVYESVYSKDHRIEICKEFYNENKRLPKQKEIYKDFKIGSFINGLKQGKNSHLKEEVESIFNTKIEVTKKLNLKDDNEKLELCKEFYNEYKRLPKRNDTYKDFNIGSFISCLKQGKNSHLKEEIENIFNTKIEANEQCSDNEKIELCKEFYNEYKRLPKMNERYKDFNIGYFINRLKKGYTSHLKEEVEKIFNTKIEVAKKLNLKDDNEKLELCKEFYNEYKRLPKDKEKYKDFNIGSFINRLKKGYTSHLKEEVEKIFNTKIEANKQRSDNEKLELCKEFYNEYKRLPKDKEKYKEFNIGNFIHNLKQCKNSHLKEEVENIFNTKI